MSIETYLLYLGVVAAFFATPPDTSQLLIMSNSLRHGLRRSMATIAGDLSANVIQMTLAAFGLSAILASNADAFAVIKWAGVAYLAWIGFRLITSKTKGEHSEIIPRGKLFRQGFVTSSANPYAVIFFAALFPQFIDPALAIIPQLVILGVTYLLVDGLILVLWGWLAVRTLGRIKALNSVWMHRISGAMMIGAAALLGAKDFTPEAGK